jgi:chorismate synthase
MVEAMAALVLMDQLMAHIAQCEIFPLNLDLQEPVGSASSLSEMSILEQKSL